MRRLGFLALGVLCGALAVSGQDGGGDELAREIERLKRLLEKRIAEATPPEDGTVVPRTYDVADLVLKIRDQLQPFEDLGPSGHRPPEPPEDTEPTSDFEVDSLIEMIKVGIEPESWEIEGTGIEPKDGRLLVRTLPRVHRRIESHLAWCRKAMDRRVSVEVSAVPVKEADAALLSGALELSAEEARRLTAGALGTVTLSGWDAQVLGGRAGRELSYVQDIEVGMVDGKPVADPITHRIFSGCTAQVLVCLDEAEGAILHCRLELSRIQEPPPAHPTPHGHIELPRKHLTRVLASFWAPLGRTVVAGGSTVGQEPCVLLVTVRRK
jgi:hypothetical protein